MASGVEYDAYFGRWRWALGCKDRVTGSIDYSQGLMLRIKSKISITVCLLHLRSIAQFLSVSSVL